MTRLWLALLALFGAALPAASAERPNVVVILADDLGWADLGAYGASFHETPHLDRLASEGVRFTQAYAASPVCSPTRASLWTGRYPVRSGVTDFIPGFHPNGRKLTPPRARPGLPLAERTLGEAFADAGYDTFYAGKWHLGRGELGPGAQGFATVVGSRKLGNPHRDWRVGARLTDAALAFLDARDPARPFLMVLAYPEPHAPVLEYPQHIAHFRAKAAALPEPRERAIAERGARTRVVQDDPAYASEVAGLDDHVGRVLAKLDETGLAAHSVVVFLSDNGGSSTRDAPGAGPSSNFPLRAGKGWLYEGGIRVPLLVRGAGGSVPGTRIDAPVATIDLMPTLLELAGVKPPSEPALDGTSFAPLLRVGEPPAARPLFWHHPHYHGSTAPPAGAIRSGDWKLIEWFEDGQVELYDLATDPGERADRAASEPERVASLRRALAAWRAQTGAVVPTPAAAASPPP